MIVITDKQNCCGCSACAAICPQQAITMQADKLGFKYPQIDLKKCVNCGLCENVCSFSKLVRTPLDKSKHSQIYACRMKDLQEVAKSQSGGATQAIAAWILAKGGVVYGAAFGEHCTVRHTRSTTQEERDKQRGSKYVQSDMGNCFVQVKEDLQNGHYVLFTGTGCQVAGLLQYVQTAGLDTRKLYTCDLICHGVPSPRLWNDYVNYVEQKKLKKPIVKAVFRDKEHYGWASHKETFYTTYTTYTTYTYIFYDHVAFRSSCGICPYASTHRLADFTVCDFWGYQKTVPEMGADNKGLSLCFISSPKAQTVFEEIKEKLIWKQIPEQNCLQPNMQHPSKLNINSKQFEQDYIAHGFEYILHKYGRRPLLQRFKHMVGKILGKQGGAIAKKILGKTTGFFGN